VVGSGTPGAQRDAHIRAISTAPLFKDLSSVELAEVAGSARASRVLRKQQLCREGEPARELFLLCTGRVKVMQLTAGGDVLILRIAGPGEVVGGLGLVMLSPEPATPEALEACELLAWETRVFEDLANRFAPLRRNALRILAERLRELEERYRDLATERVAPRLARTLLRLMGQIGRPHGGGVQIGLSREELGQLTGTTLFTVSRLLSQWESLGYLETGREAVRVHDPRGLVALAEGERGDDTEQRPREQALRLRR
jgi:CRP-like cAMP-binding protein